MKYLGLDVETGGIGHDKSLLTVYMGIFDENLNLLESKAKADLDLKIKPENGIYNVQAQGLGVNKINLVEHDKVAETPKELKTLVHAFLKYHSNHGKDKLIPLGHRVAFDVAFVTQTPDKILSKETWDHFVSYRCADTGPTGQFLKDAGLAPQGISGSLSSWAKHFGIDFSNAHNAKADVEMTVAIYKRMLQLVKKEQVISPH